MVEYVQVVAAVALVAEEPCPSNVFAARSRRAATFAREKPTLRMSSSLVVSRSSGVGN